MPVNVYLTGVPSGTNMTDNDQQVFDSLMEELLTSRLETVDVTVLGVDIVSQTPSPEVLPVESSATFDFQGGGDEGQPGVLQTTLNITISYNPQSPPEGMRDWSIYLKSWIESFGVTMVEILSLSEHELHPQTASDFWDGLVDVSATNVVPPNTDPTASPTPAPTLPETSDAPADFISRRGIIVKLVVNLYALYVLIF